MDTSKLQELHAEIVKLRNKIEDTDSKKETSELQRQLDSLEDEFEDVAYELLNEIPDEIELRLTVDKVVDYDTAFVKDDVVSNLLEMSDISGINLVEELQDAIINSYYPADYIYDEDIDVEIADDRFE